MDGAKGALPTCAVGEKPTDAAIHAVPAPVSTASNIDDGRPSSSVGVVAPRPWGWKWGNMVAFIYTCVEVASLGFLATLPLRVGDKVTPRAEDMAYWKRFIAVSILRMVGTPEPLSVRTRAPSRCIHRGAIPCTCKRTGRSRYICLIQMSKRIRLSFLAILFNESLSVWRR